MTSTLPVMTATKTTTSKRTVKVYSYGRISSGIQRKGRGKKRQDADAVKWCEDNGHTLEPANCFVETMSAFKKRNNAEHGELKIILNLIEDGQIEPGSILLVESLDRLSRKNINIAVSLLLQIINAGVIVITLIDGATYRSDANPHELMASLIMSVAIFMRANDESRTKSMRKGDSWKAKREAAQRGEYHGGRVPSWIKVVNGKYQVIEEEAKRVRAIFDDYVNGLGLYRLKAKHGVAVPTISWWLDHPTVIGTLTVTEAGQKVQYPNHYPAIIDRKTFDAAKHRRAERYVKPQRGRSRVYINLFAGLLFDPKGEWMQVVKTNGTHWNCTSPGYMIRAKYMEHVIVGWKLATKFVRVREVADDEGTDHKALAKIENDLLQIQATMMEEPGTAVRLLPLMRKLEQQKRSLVGTPKVVREKFSWNVIRDLLHEESSEDARMKLREIAQQNIQSIKLTKVEGGNWYVMVHGDITLKDGEVVPMRFAYHTRREGFIICDTNHGSHVMNMPTKHPMSAPIMTDTITDELKAALNKLPLRCR
jgi:DNA invertase Pin-like site-specific DNA recombinase